MPLYRGSCYFYFGLLSRSKKFHQPYDFSMAAPMVASAVAPAAGRQDFFGQGACGAS